MSSRPTSATSDGTFGSRCAPKFKDYSMNPKVSLYRTDGTGRDTYINIDNGGFRNTLSNNFRKIYTIKNESGKTTNINPKFSIYKSDGYGRDSYIVSTSGGFFQEQHPKYFPKTLRTHEGFSKYKKNDFLHYSNKFQSPEMTKQKRILSLKQRVLSARLSKPKY